MIPDAHLIDLTTDGLALKVRLDGHVVLQSGDHLSGGGEYLVADALLAPEVLPSRVT